MKEESRERTGRKMMMKWRRKEGHEVKEGDDKEKDNRLVRNDSGLRCVDRRRSPYDVCRLDFCPTRSPRAVMLTSAMTTRSATLPLHKLLILADESPISVTDQTRHQIFRRIPKCTGCVTLTSCFMLPFTSTCSSELGHWSLCILHVSCTDL